MKRIGGIRITWLVWAGAGLIAGCGPADTSQPPAVRFGEEACAGCRMIISDERFAAARVDADGETLKFDDFGCLLGHDANEVRPAAVYWVRNVSGKEWLNARQAIFVHSAKVISPMGHGLAAVPTAQSARELAADPDSRTLRFEQLAGFFGETRRERRPPLTEGR
jgi:copper chaperone NosL